MVKKYMDNRKPLLIVFAGPNGSGKSTITANFGKLDGYTNADDIVKETKIPNKEAAEYVIEKRYNAIENNEDFSFETVLSSKYNIDVIKKAHEKGYFIKCIYVLTANPELNVYRIQSRVKQGGHDVPVDKIIDRYYKSLKNIRELINLCDILHIYDNTGDKPLRIFRKHKEEPFKIFPNDYWSEKQILELIED